MMQLITILWVQLYHEINHAECNLGNTVTLFTFKGNFVIMYQGPEKEYCIFILKHFLKKK